MLVRPRLWSFLVLLALALAGASQARGAEQADRSQTVNCLTSSCVYLPIIFRPTVATITFGMTADSQFVPNPPMTTFPSDARKMYYNAAITAGAGRSYRLEWTINDQREPSIDDSGVVDSDPDNISGLICFTQPGTTCDNPTSTLRPGDYLLQLSIDDVLLTEGRATVQAPPDGTATSDPAFSGAQQFRRN